MRLLTKINITVRPEELEEVGADSVTQNLANVMQHVNKLCLSRWRSKVRRLLSRGQRSLLEFRWTQVALGWKEGCLTWVRLVPVSRYRPSEVVSLGFDLYQFDDTDLPRLSHLGSTCTSFTIPTFRGSSLLAEIDQSDDAAFRPWVLGWPCPMLATGSVGVIQPAVLSNQWLLQHVGALT
ncbi:hypothetical protein RRG08_007927 [Elysia crispata]|uniref:Uncharacterized protein n=1 Tax=Elysia crispata TaxID=231223 RepID=A0AAE0ZPX8_9GAST|nr:hypothetical protein RRG08_007927 [Elysia crispata]